jgi:hypothetical protein
MRLHWKLLRPSKPDQGFVALYHMLAACSVLAAISACAAQPATISTQTPFSKSPGVPISPTIALVPTPSQTSPAMTPSRTSFICNADWGSLPVIPEVTETARELYQQGLAKGNDSHAFSKIGDGEISTEWFLADFGLGSDRYNLGRYQNLSALIENFHGSFSRIGVAARRGFNTNLILDPSAADSTVCDPDASPLECELRLHNPSIAILSLGTNQVHRPEEFEAGMRRILENLLSRNVLPILSTKGDNLERDHRINRTIACLAEEYQIPLWNFWKAIQSLPNHGLQPDLEHLTYYGSNDFDDPVAMQSAWTVRNLTALQVLNAVWQGVK